MSSFVDECRKEWSRLGVPEAEANEMATDLEADLAEAKAEGVSPEEVLGNGYFDPRSFAASWADPVVSSAGAGRREAPSKCEPSPSRWVPWSPPRSWCWDWPYCSELLWSTEVL